LEYYVAKLPRKSTIVQRERRGERHLFGHFPRHFAGFSSYVRIPLVAELIKKNKLVYKIQAVQSRGEIYQILLKYNILKKTE